MSLSLNELDNRLKLVRVIIRRKEEDTPMTALWLDGDTFEIWWPAVSLRFSKKEVRAVLNELRWLRDTSHDTQLKLTLSPIIAEICLEKVRGRRGLGSA